MKIYIVVFGMYMEGYEIKGVYKNKDHALQVAMELAVECSLSEVESDMIYFAVDKYEAEYITVLEYVPE